MKKRLIFTGLLFVLFAACCFAQKPYKVVFYNLENFFDTINDPEVNDDEFTPEGPKNGTLSSMRRSWAIPKRCFSILPVSIRIIRS